MSAAMSYGAEVVGEAEEPVRLVRVVPLRLERVRADLVAEADAAPFLAQVEEHAAAALGDEVEGAVELRAAVALERPEHLARQALEWIRTGRRRRRRRR